MIEKYQQDDGSFIDEDGISHSNAVDFICDILGFCGCGRPEEAIHYVYQSLQLIKQRSNILYTDSWEKESESWNQAVSAHFPVEGSKYFMWYFLDAQNLTEHGVGVPGWLSQKGHELMADIERYCAMTA